MLATLEIVHLGGEVRTVPIVQFTPYTLYFSWPMCGLYELRVKTNRIVGLKNWKAKNHEAAKHLLRTLNGEREARYVKARHG